MYIDLLLLFLVGFLSLLGFIHGFIRQILSLTMWITIFFLATPLAEAIKTQTSLIWLQKAPVLALWGLSALMIGVTFLLVSGLITWFKKDMALVTPLDRYLGAGLGGLKGILFALLIAAAFGTLPEKMRVRFPEVAKDSRDSAFVSAGVGMLEWKMPAMNKLREVRSTLTEDTDLRLPSFDWPKNQRSESDQGVRRE